MTDTEMIKAIYEDMQRMKLQIKDLQLTLENEVRRLKERIERIA